METWKDNVSATTYTRCTLTTHLHGLGARLLGLRHMQIHLIAIEISIVRRANTLVETECTPRPNLGVVCHDTQFVKRWLAVEQNNVVVIQMSLYQVSDSQLVCHALSVIDELEKPFHLTFGLDVIGTGMDISAVDDTTSQTFNVVCVHRLRVGQDLGHVHRHCDLINAEVWVRRNDCASTKVHALSRQVSTESTLLALQSLADAADKAPRL